MHHIEALEAQIARFDTRLLDGLAPQQHALALLQTLPGVDTIGAALLLVEIGDNLKAFGSADRLRTTGTRRLPLKDMSGRKMTWGMPTTTAKGCRRIR